MKSLALLPLSLSLASAGEILWSGIFNESYTVEDFDKWSWSTPLSPWQWYIHGPSPTDSYLSLSPEFKNPNSTATADEAQGLKITLDDTSSWNGQTMMRTELIPEISGLGSDVDLGAGVRFYHFSLSVDEQSKPVEGVEHQIAFFESHFTELKYTTTDLHWFAGGSSHWSTPLTSGMWYNFAYGIDFDAGSVELYASTGGEELALVAGPVAVSAQSDSKDWHVGVLRLDEGVARGVEEWGWSGVYVEADSLTTVV
ncbi:hypothetical protein BJY04DRAFT_214517 [Aspergillus karnatakaensis]|uniref:glycoside hydrolase family 131 protein n=1 Tax=Aspergillus karnatakaensis TaxID=1810916 RepID=UPI003CCD56D6